VPVRTRGRLSLAAAAALALGAMAPSVAPAAGTFYVDNTITCSNSGLGTEALPYCTITAALNKQGGPGTTILVKQASYREQVTVPASGASGSPLVIRALGAAMVDGSDRFDTPTQWVQASGDVWLATTVTWSPVQVFRGGGRLTPSTDDPLLLLPGTFRYMPGTGLYVNAGGGNPGTLDVFVGHRLNGFHLTGRSWVTIEGFSVVRTDEKGIELDPGSDNCELRSNFISSCASSGISLLGCADVLIEGNRVSGNEFHGIELRGGSTGCVIQDNESSLNLDPGVPIATGIYLAGSPDNRILRNRVFGNEDTGIEIQSGSDNCLSLQNVSYLNGDHGFEHLFAVGTINIGNVAWANRRDGFSIEGQALATGLFDCIAVDNGLLTNEFDLYADTSSTAGFTSDYNIFWNSTAKKPIKYHGVQYATVAAYSAASGQDANSLQADPMFTDPTNGIFHLQSGSPAIDSGTSGVAGWPAADAQGLPREDDPGVANTGAGSIPFTDRGAFEFRVSTVSVGGGRPVAGVALSGAFPNPARAAVAFTLDLPAATSVEWSVFDVQGRKLGGGAGWRPAGRSLVSWNEGREIANGVRFARFVVDGQTLTRRFATVR